MLLKLLRFPISTTSKLLFLGSDAFAYHPLVSLHTSFPTLHVATHHTQPNIRSPNPVQDYCLSHSIPCLTPIHKSSPKPQRNLQWQQFLSHIQTEQYDLGIICSYGFMIPETVIRQFKHGMIVIHPSLLPKYRGGAPIFHAIANGEKETGVSFVEVSVGKFDAGDVVYQTKVEIGTEMEYVQVEDMLSKNAAEHVVDVVLGLKKFREGKWKQSDRGEGSKAPIVNSKMLNLGENAERVYNLSRAIKGPRVNFQGKELIVKLKGEYLEAEPVDKDTQNTGSVFKKGKKVFIRCGDGRAVRLFEFKEPSKVYYPASAFANQHLKNGLTLFT